MKLEAAEITWLDERAEYSLRELAESSQLPEAVLRELNDYGVLAPRDPGSGRQSFDGAVLMRCSGLGYWRIAIVLHESVRSLNHSTVDPKAPEKRAGLLISSAYHGVLAVKDERMECARRLRRSGDP